MNFFNKYKSTSLLLSIVVGTVLTVTGCTDISSTTEDTLNLNAFSTNVSIPHITSIKTPLDTSANNPLVIKATVDRVVDGDTVELILPDGSKVDTRLLLIDTPETKHPDLGVQKYGPEASQFAKSVLLKGDTVYFELDGKSKTDKYGRYLGYLWYTCYDHNALEMYNERVVEEGLARVGYIYDQTKYLNPLLKTEAIAKNSKLNIWSIPGYVTDKGYNMDKVNNPTNNDVSTKTQTFVYISDSSKLYHKESNSHGMKSATKIDKLEAETKGYKPCTTCFK